MKRNFKYRIYSNKQTIIKANYWLDLCKNLYNVALEQRILAWKQNHKSISYYYQTNEIPDLRKMFPEYKEIDAQALREPLHRVDFNFKAFWGRIRRGERAGFPRFKNKNQYSSLTFYQNSWVIKRNYLFIRNLCVV